jgi:3-dehydrosphinganine reductase
VTAKKRIYITGGSSGIGLGLARHYASAGNDLVLLARDQSKLDAAVSACRDLAVNAGQVIAAVSLDITAYDKLAMRMDSVVFDYGSPDLLILSAGIAGNKIFLDTSAAEFDRMVDINLAGSREVARTLLPAMLQRGSGQIAFVSSIAGLMGIYGYSAYSASKFAVTGLSQALRQELAGTGVSVHLVCPPEVNTPMIQAESLAAVPQTRFLKDLVGTLEPDVVARKIARGIDRRKALIVPGVRAGLMVWTSRHFPGLFAWSSERLLRWKFG